jgi:hypothetical protein
MTSMTIALIEPAGKLPLEACAMGPPKRGHDRSYGETMSIPYDYGCAFDPRMVRFKFVGLRQTPPVSGADASPAPSP